MNKRVHAVYSGRVQGIGFRYTVEEIALNLAVKGWVKNLADGTVEITAEAPDDRLKLFLDKIKDHFLSYIQDVELDWFPATGEFKDFVIAF